MISPFATAGPSQPLRVVTLAPHATSLAISAGLADQLVGVSRFSVLPAHLQELPQVADFMQINLEQILALQPSLIIALPAQKYHKQALAFLQQAGIKIYYSNPSHFDEMIHDVSVLAQYAASAAVAKAHIRAFEQRLQQIALTSIKQGDKPSIRYLYILNLQPLMALSGSGWPAEVFDFCGGDNVLASRSVAVTPLNLEQIIALKPQVIFADKAIAEQLARMQPLKQIASQVKIWPIDSRQLTIPSLQVIDAVAQLCQDIDTLAPRLGTLAPFPSLPPPLASKQ